MRQPDLDLSRLTRGVAARSLTRGTDWSGSYARWLFPKASDPTALAAWYRENLGVPLDEGRTNGMMTSEAASEMTVWSTFPADTDYFGSVSAMINYRVRDLDAMLEQLRRAGADVDERVEDDEYGRFGWATDPEGNRFELWQPSEGAT